MSSYRVLFGAGLSALVHCSSGPGGREETCESQGIFAVPAQQRVTVQLVNRSTTERFVVAGGAYPGTAASCPLYTVEGPQGALKLLDADAPAGVCEAPAPANEPHGVRRLQPGDTLTLVWDGRATTRCLRRVRCSPGAGSDDYQWNEVSRPVAAGSYRMALQVTDSASALAQSPCMPASAGPTVSYWCMHVGSSTAACFLPSAAWVFADFTLPPTGDVTVELAIR